MIPLGMEMNYEIYTEGWTDNHERQGAWYSYLSIIQTVAWYPILSQSMQSREISDGHQCVNIQQSVLSVCEYDQLRV